MYVITGATGHIGNNLCHYLVEQKESVRILIRQKDHSLDDLDVLTSCSHTFSEAFLDQAIDTNDVIIHVAGYVNLTKKNRLETYRANVQLTKILIAIAKKKSCRFVYISSVDVILKPKKGIVSEPHTFDQCPHKSYYQTSKWLATKYVYDAIENGLNGIILYPSAVIGPRDIKPSRIGLELIKMMKKRVLFSIRGGYNFIDVRDVVKGIYVASKFDTKEHMILSGIHLSVTDLYRMVSDITHAKKIIIKVPLFIAKIYSIIHPKYSKLMIDSLLENDNYDDSKRKVHLFDELTPFDKTLSDTLSDLNILSTYQ
ncbi:MAG: NAD-dependent epimerase/dehydratase family protein [Acholeplasmataceae bacterium]|nr:NAD-dependent epimerase/dehydratase family protein [Acholeplasmataceae bacterium]